MKKKRINKKKIICFVLVLIAIALIAIVAFNSGSNEITKADSIGELAFSVSIKNTDVMVDIYYYSGECYLFLPSGSTKYDVANLDRGDKLEISDDVICFYNASKNEETIAPFHLMVSGNVGSVFIELNGSNRFFLDDHYKEKIEGKAKIYDESGKLVNNKSLSFIRNRGNGTYAFTTKKAYEIKFNEEVPVLGMDKAKKWVLLANYYDGSLMRNALVLDFAKKNTNILSEDGRYIDLYIDGEYLGNYYLCEKVEVAKNRIDIKDGYLVELIPNNLIRDDTIYFTTDGGYNYEIKYPELASIDQKNYIKDIFNELEEAVKSDDGVAKSTGRHYSEIIDVDSWIEKYLVETVFMNTDIGYNSQYYYIDNNEQDRLIKAGPVWDYDMAMHYNAEPYVFNAFYLQDEMLGFKDVRLKCLKKYVGQFETYIEKDVENDLRKLSTDLYYSQKMNSVRWAGQINNFSYGYSSLEANAEYISEKLKERAKYVKNELEEKNDYKVISFNEKPYNMMISGEILDKDLPTKTPNYIQLFAGWKDAESGKTLHTGDEIKSDMDVEVSYIYLSYLLTHSIDEIIADRTDVSGIDPDDLDKIANILERMKNE